MKKTIALLSYLTWIGFILAVFFFVVEKEKDSYVKFHLRQAFGLGLLAIALYAGLAVLGYNLFEFTLPSLIVALAFFILWFMGFKSAMDETQRELPVVGKYFQKWFTFF